MKNIKEIINEEIENLNEIFDSKIKTEYKIITSTKYDAVTYQFSTKSGVVYDLEFYRNEISNQTKLERKFRLCDIIKANCNDNTYAVDISFTIDDRLKNDDDISDDEYNKLTNNNETVELMGKISYLVDIFMRRHSDIKIYCIGVDSNEDNRGEDKLIVYSRMFENIFRNNFIKFKGDSENYKDKDDNNIDTGIYFINKNILKQQ